VWLQKMKANLIGIAVLIMLINIIILLIPGDKIPSISWLFICAMWIICAIFVWYHKSAPEQPRLWLLLAAKSMGQRPCGLDFQESSRILSLDQMSLIYKNS
jgi:hypothetical protein